MIRLLSLVLVLLCAVPAFAQEGKSTTISGEKSNPFERLRQPESPEGLYNKGLGQMKRGYFDEAIISFEKVRNHFPFNQYSVLSELRVADCLFEKAAYLEAVDAYLRFQKLHPRHPQIDYVVYRTARSEFKLAPLIPQRDQSHSTRGLRRLKGFHGRFPESQYRDAVDKLRGKAFNRLARGALQIGNHYWKQKEWKAAERRYRLAAEEYPDAPIVSKARLRRGLCLWRLEDQAGAREVLADLVVVDPDSRWGKAALTFLERNPAGESAPAEEPAAAEEPTSAEAPPAAAPDAG